MESPTATIPTRWTPILRLSGGGTIIEFSIPNDGDSPWFWAGAGREIGAAFVVTDDQRRLYSVYEPYRLFYARMLAK